MSAEELSLRWHDHHEALLSVFENLLRSNTLVDCTLAAEGKHLKAHKVVLSACSPYFQSLFKEDCDKHPIIILKDVKFWTLKAVIDFVYCGEVKIRENQLGAFLEVAGSLEVKGLGTGSQDDSSKEAGPNLEALSREESPTPRKRPRRHRTSASEGDNHEFSSRNNNFQYNSQQQTRHTEVPSVPSTSHATAPVFSTTSNSNPSVSGTGTNDSQFETNRSSKTVSSSGKTPPPEVVPMVKLEPETEPFQEAKVEYTEEANEDYMEDTSVANDMASAANEESMHGHSSPQHDYSGFEQSYPDTEDLDSQHPYMPGQDVQQQSLQDLPSLNVETVDLSSDDSSSQVMQRDPSSSEGPPARVSVASVEPWRDQLPTAFVFAAQTSSQPTSSDFDPFRKHGCPHCGKRFTWPSGLAQHIRTHTGEEPFRCQQCGTTFNKKSSLTRHMKGVHKM